LHNLRTSLQAGEIKIYNKTQGETFSTHHSLSPRQTEMILAGSLINLIDAQ
jgi:hypothetical protein